MRKRTTARKRQDAANKLTRIQAESHAEAAGVYTGRKQPKRISEKTLLAGGRAAYESWIKEAGFQNDARIVEWPKLKDIHRVRWSNIARAVIDATRD